MSQQPKFSRHLDIGMVWAAGLFFTTSLNWSLKHVMIKRCGQSLGINKGVAKIINQGKMPILNITTLFKWNKHIKTSPMLRVGLYSITQTIPRSKINPPYEKIHGANSLDNKLPIRGKSSISPSHFRMGSPRNQSELILAIPPNTKTQPI